MKKAKITVMIRQRMAFVVTLVIVIGGLAVAALRQVYGETENRPMTHIGVEHANPLTMSIALHTSGGTWGIVDIGTVTHETVFISLPDHWRRREVRNVPLHDVQSDPPSFGFVRYTFPPEAIVSFIIPDLPESLLLHNPSKVPIQLNLTTVNTATQVVNHNVILLQESPKEIW